MNENDNALKDLQNRVDELEKRVEVLEKLLLNKMNEDVDDGGRLGTASGRGFLGIFTASLLGDQKK